MKNPFAKAAGNAEFWPEWNFRTRSKGYSARVEYDDESGILVGRVLGINDIIDFHGDSVEAIRREFHVAIDEYLKACEKIGVKFFFRSFSHEHG